MSEAINVLAVLVAAMLAGNELAIAAFVHPVLSRLDDSSHARAIVPLARVTGRVMPFWYAAAVGLAVAAAWTRPTGGVGWWLALSAAGLLVGSVVYTLVVLLPINNRVAGWNPAAPPQGWEADRRRWDFHHRVRVLVVIAAATLLAAATVTF